MSNNATTPATPTPIAFNDFLSLNPQDKERTISNTYALTITVNGQTLNNLLEILTNTHSDYYDFPPETKELMLEQAIMQLVGRKVESLNEVENKIKFHNKPLKDVRPTYLKNFLSILDFLESKMNHAIEEVKVPRSQINIAIGYCIGKADYRTINAYLSTMSMFESHKVREYNQNRPIDERIQISYNMLDLEGFRHEINTILTKSEDFRYGL